MRANSLGRALAYLTESKLAWFGISVIALLFFLGLFGPSLLSVSNPNAISSALLTPPSQDAWFGTDELGRSVLAQVVYGTRTSLTVGLLAALSALLIGVTVGAVAGFIGGRVDSLLMRLIEIFR